MGVKSLLCVPILYENECLGVLSSDNVKSKRQLTISDMNLLMGVASQMAVGIMNARSYQKVHESEKKYRELVENSNSIIMRMDIRENITFFNEYAQKISGCTEDQILGRGVLDVISPVNEVEKNYFNTIVSRLIQNLYLIMIWC